MNYQGLDLQKLYDALALIVGQEENLTIKFTIERREEK